MMGNYLHRVTGIYATREGAESTRNLLANRGLKPAQLEIFDASTVRRQPDPESAEPDSDEVRNEVLVDSAIGTAIGTGLGALGEMALAAANISLFVASPVIGTLAMMGWGAVVGGIVGATAGAGTENTRHFADLVHDAVTSGHAVLIVHAETEEETTLAQTVIAESVQASN